MLIVSGFKRPREKKVTAKYWS